MAITASLTNYGEKLFAEMVLKNTISQRPNFKLCLYTDSTITDNNVEATTSLTVPTAGQYTDKQLVDSSWIISGEMISYPPQTFSPVGSNYEKIYGFAIVTDETPSKPIVIFRDTSAPTLTPTTPYIITISMSIVPSSDGGNIENLLKMIFKKDTAIRGAGLKLALFTNENDVSATTLAGIHEPTGGGYERKTIADTDWVIDTSGVDAIGTLSAPVTFTPAGEKYSAIIKGYSVALESGAILYSELDPSGGVDIPLNTPYQLSPSIKFM